MSAGTPAGDPLALVLDALHRVLKTDPALAADTDLFGVPGFDSLALVELVAVLEEQLGEPLEDELITPEVFATPAGIARELAPRLSAKVSARRAQ